MVRFEQEGNTHPIIDIIRNEAKLWDQHPFLKCTKLCNSSDRMANIHEHHMSPWQLFKLLVCKRLPSPQTLQYPTLPQLHKTWYFKKDQQTKRNNTLLHVTPYAKKELNYVPTKAIATLTAYQSRHSQEHLRKSASRQCHGSQTPSFLVLQYAIVDTSYLSAIDQVQTPDRSGMYCRPNGAICPKSSHLSPLAFAYLL